MVKAEQIPDEALEAAAEELYEQERDLGGRSLPSWEDVGSTTKRRFYKAARAACLAMLEAWPGMKEHSVQVPDDDSDDIRYRLKTIGIILPLHPEKETSE